MHEMGIVLNIVREAERQAELYRVKKIGSLTLEVGELTGAEPPYIRNCWPAATENTILEGAQLIIKEVEGLVSCKDCGCVYRVLEHMTKDLQADCPKCHSSQWTLKQGREVMIDEIGVFDE